MNKTVLFTIKKEYSWIEIDEQISAYECVTFKNDIEKERVEGIALTKDLEEVTAETDVLPFKKSFRKDRGIPVSIIHTDFLEIIRNRPIYEEKVHEKYDAMVLDKPYSFLKEHSMDNMMLIYLDYGNHHFWDHQGNSIPRAMRFDYTNGSISNQYYDLEKVLKSFKNRTDIDWPVGPKILPIPYYNVEDGHDQYLDFYWMPTNEDFKKAEPYLYHPFELRQFILKEILGLKNYYKKQEYED